jgi:hypothetical protein
MAWFLALAIGVLLLPAAAYCLWRLFMPERFGGSPALARGEWQPLPWRWLLPIGLVFLVVFIVSTVSMSSAPPLPSAPIDSEITHG